tara:strand:+ start:8292 stop:8849 length:558 start_codon:yes stop_codon:yes gene_type:complete
MERRVKNKVDTFISEFKEAIKNNFNESIKKINFENQETLEASLKEFQMLHIQYLYNYENITLTDEDFKKRKRIKNTIPLEDRCCAFRANKQQCSRRKLDDNMYCGTHLKGQPHGIITDIQHPQKKTISVWSEDIKGILYYIDTDGKVYDTEDILTNKPNPKVIAKYEKSLDTNGNTIYSIPEFNI